jgi:nitrogen fixation/metabolism regulation signal transduction histidine kinase
LLHRGIPIGVVIPIFAALLLLFGLGVVFLRYRQTRDVRAVVRGLTGQAGIVEIDHRGRVRHANPRARELLGGGMLPAGLLTQATKAALAEPVRSQPKELPVALDSGKTVLARAARVGSGVLLTLEDISAVEYLKRVSAWVPVAQKLAHDIKNPLTAISLTLQRVEKAAGPDSQRHVDSMRDDIDRLRKMADGFMRLTRLEPPKLAPADINEVIRQCAGKFDDVKPADVVFQYELAEGLPLAALDRDQMAVALSNIIENAISAMGEAGRLVVRSSYIVSEKKIAISVSDTGKGIPERYVSKVFEPYFSLKPGGTGLGMALTKRIVDDHKGTIEIESKEDVGTAVTVELPVAGTKGA